MRSSGTYSCVLPIKSRRCKTLPGAEQVDEILGAAAARETIIASRIKYEQEYVAKAHHKHAKAAEAAPAAQ